uniref:Uncharacterized protein n=2 Tax=Oryza sativa subsp. japonica TaxID=39947 RepID=Q69IY2_ORYSJ|nr:hypothetical protein [Oryza sativa Japonica Group]BAD32078.1 hypothetical protein [Oryza sativa Japonica Group]
MDSQVKFMQNFLEKGAPVHRSRQWKTPVKSIAPTKKPEKPAQKKLPNTPKAKKVWRVKQTTPTPSSPETGGKSAN